MSRPRSAHSGCFVRGALAALSPKKGSVCGGKGVPEAACPSLAVPKGPRHLFNPRLLSLRRGLAMLAVAGGAQGVWGSAPHLFSQPTLLETGAGEQLECLASWGAAALTSHVLGSCYSCCSGKSPGHKEARPLSPSPAHQCQGALLCFPGTAKAAEESLGCVGCSGQHAGSCPCPWQWRWHKMIPSNPSHLCSAHPISHFYAGDSSAWLQEQYCWKRHGHLDGLGPGWAWPWMGLVALLALQAPQGDPAISTATSRPQETCPGGTKHRARRTPFLQPLFFY